MFDVLVLMMVNFLVIVYTPDTQSIRSVGKWIVSVQDKQEMWFLVANRISSLTNVTIIDFLEINLN